MRARYAYKDPIVLESTAVVETLSPCCVGLRVTTVVELVSLSPSLGAATRFDQLMELGVVMTLAYRSFLVRC